MAFMMPVVKQDYDIYSGPNSRKNSVCSTSPGTNKSRSSSRNNSVSSSPTQAAIVTPEEARKILIRRRSRGMSECLHDLTKIEDSEELRHQRRRSSLGKLSWSSLHAALQKLKPAEPKSKSQSSVDEDQES